jgi:DNA-binding MarR family transcriptional regulator
MTSGDQVHAGEPASDVARLRLATLRLSRAIRTHAVEELTPSQLAILGTVIRNAPITIGGIAEIEHVKPPSVSKIVSALESVGFVERRTDPDDRRCQQIVASDAGAAYVRSVATAGKTWLAHQLGQLDDADRAAIVAAVPALERLLALDPATSPVDPGATPRDPATVVDVAGGTT